jgi:hypothetical protein
VFTVGGVRHPVLPADHRGGVPAHRVHGQHKSFAGTQPEPGHLGFGDLGDRP